MVWYGDQLCCIVIIIIFIFSILYQRGIYPPENFKREQKYGLTLLVTDDEQLKEYISNVLTQVKGLHVENILIKALSYFLQCLKNALWQFKTSFFCYFRLVV